MHTPLNVFAFVAISSAAFAAQDLPVGSAPPPLPFDHFPGRLEAVVWRNWQLVRPPILARVLGASEGQIRQMAASMGLPPAGDVPADLAPRAYITVLRRNWHLLPYEQLLPLVGMTRAELAESLREDDFLFEKLGNLKPRCGPVTYVEPDAQARSRAAGLKAIVEARFGAAILRHAEPRFAFGEALSRVPDGFQPASRRPGEAPRFLYSYFGSYGDPLADGAPNSYPDGLLARLSECGANGVWLHAVLRQLAPGGRHFPEFGAGHEQRLANLRRIVDRAHRFGIDVYLYMNEPRSMPEAFFARRPEMAGVRESQHRALCTSDARVRDWMNDALAEVFRAVPGLGGVFTITASENLTNCASHGQQAGCPRCKSRRPEEILAEVNATIAAGVHRGDPKAKVLVWDWGWPGPEAIRLLPPDVWLMSVSEWSLPIERGGVKNRVAEYSLSAPGPGPAPSPTGSWRMRAVSRRRQSSRSITPGSSRPSPGCLYSTWLPSIVPAWPGKRLMASC